MSSLFESLSAEQPLRLMDNLLEVRKLKTVEIDVDVMGERQTYETRTTLSYDGDRVYPVHEGIIGNTDGDKILGTLFNFGKDNSTLDSDNLAIHHQLSDIIINQTQAPAEYGEVNPGLVYLGAFTEATGRLVAYPGNLTIEDQRQFVTEALPLLNQVLDMAESIIGNREGINIEPMEGEPVVRRSQAAMLELLNNLSPLLAPNIGQMNEEIGHVQKRLLHKMKNFINSGNVNYFLQIKNMMKHMTTSDTMAYTYWLNYLAIESKIETQVRE